MGKIEAGVARDLTEEERQLLEIGKRAAKEAENLPPPSKAFQAKMDDQALTNAVLGQPGPARDAYLEVTSMPRDEFEAEFADVLNRNAYDEDEGSES